MITTRTERMSDFFTKYHLDGLPFAAVLHHFTAPDTGDMHDHPWPFRSHVLQGWYTEETPRDTLHHAQGDSFYVSASHIHRIMEISEGGVWTIIIPGPHERTPGFYRFDDGKVFHRFWNEGEFRLL